MLLERRLRQLAETVRVDVVERQPDDPAAGDEPGTHQMEQPRQQLAAREIAGRTDQYDDVGITGTDTGGNLGHCNLDAARHLTVRPCKIDASLTIASARRLSETLRPALLTHDVARTILEAAARGTAHVECSLDLGRTRTRVALRDGGWVHDGVHRPLPVSLRERTIYHWDGTAFTPVSRYGGALIKLVPTEWGPPTFEIDGIKMLPTAKVSPFEDAKRKVALVSPRGRRVLDTCGGLGYFAACALEAGAAAINSYEKNADVLWLRTFNPWSPPADPRLTVTQADVSVAIADVPSGSVDAVLHDPPRFGIAGELYSQRFYDELARVLAPRGAMFHYTGTPNRLTSGRDVPGEVLKRLQRAGFEARRDGDGIFAVRGRTSRRSAR